MESDAKDMTTVEGNIDSPCSALLERLKNLRRWQDEQRKGISLNQYGGGFAVTSPKENEFPQDVMLNDKEALQPDNHEGLNNKNYDQSSESKEGELTASSGFFQSSEGSLRNISPRSFSENISSVGGEPCRVDKCNQEDLFGQNISKDNINVRVSSSPTLPLQDDDKQLGSSKNDLRTVVQTQEHLTVGNADVKKCIASEPSGESRTCDLKLNPRNEDVYERKFQGLTNFISRHAVSNSVTDNNVHIPGFNLKASDENSVSQSQPKFSYLKKGQGTARFGMKSLRLRKAENSTQNNAEEREMHNGYQLSKPKSNITSQNYTLKAGMPVKTLQLHQDHKSRSGYEKFREGAVKQTSAEKNGPLRITESDVQQKKVTSVSESDKQRRKELEELSAFEKLEELAEDSSFSSSSSTVIRLLQRGLWSSSSTPMKSTSPSPCFSPQFQLNKKESTNIFFNQSDLQQNQFPLVNVSSVLEQLRKLVRIEDLPLSGLSEEELKSVLESFVESENSFNVGSASCFESNIKLTSSNPTSTPAVYDGVVVDRPRVHFQPEGVQVLEYEISESDEENTLTDMASIADDTDLVTTSDLEVLTQMNFNPIDTEGLKKKQSLNEFCKEQNEGVLSKEIINKMPIRVSSSEGLQPVRLQFSPPCRPKNSASHYIWSIFGKEETRRKAQQSKTLQQVSSKEVKSSVINAPESVQEEDSQTLKASENKIMKSIEERESFPSANKIGSHEELDTHKALLMAKVCELEKEIDFYKKGNTKIKNLQESLENEKCQFDQQKRIFQEEMAKEKAKFQEYLDCERNKLWKEKQLVKQHSPSIASSREQSMEVIFLKEQLKDLQEELKKKESLHDAAMKKLDEKIRLQEQELRSLRLKNASLQKSFKDNSQQNQNVERCNKNRKPLTNNKPVALPTVKPKMKTKTATISSINRSLDKVPITINDPLRDRQALMRDLPVHNKILSSGRQTRSSPVNQDCNSGKKDSLQAYQQTNHTELLGRTITPDQNKNAQESNIAALNDRREDVNELQGVSCENQSAINSNKVKENSAINITPGFFNSKVKSNIAYEMEMSPQSQQSSNIESTEICLDDGTREIIYANGNKKSIHLDGTVIVNYYNGDKKEIRQDRTIYVYGTDRTSHTTFVNGKEVLEFPNGQKETRFSDGSSEIIFPDKTRKTVLPDGTEVCTLPNGTIVHTNADGFKVMEFVSGQKEVHTPDQKRREYPDGTVKILHSDGRTETRYKTGRVRIKDREGNILSDSHQSVQSNHR
ncbi:centromere protein J [Palaemon carinicauda]|uniref:centromere protein J n=1 Tax=Palaemon carinicauda TaxID=392227 RepID=UPI0035B570B0